MGIPLETWWRKDSTLHSYVFCGFLIGLPFTVFNTYVVYQLQTVGFLIGTNVDGQPCLSTYCIVPWAGSNLDLNSIILYMNAIGFGVGGVVTLFLSAYSDFWSKCARRQDVPVETRRLQSTAVCRTKASSSNNLHHPLRGPQHSGVLATRLHDREL